MFAFGHSVREVERTHNRIVVEETGTRGVGWAFLIFGLGLLSSSLWIHGGIPARFFVAVVGLAFAALGLLAFTRSRFIADREHHDLIIERNIVIWTFWRSYDARMIDRILVRATRKGNGLAIRFRSGRNKNLTISDGFGSDLGAVASAMNHFLHTHHEA